MKKQTICLSTITLTYILISAQNSFCMEWFTPVDTEKKNWGTHIRNAYILNKKIANQHPYSCGICLTNHTYNPKLEISLEECRHSYCNKCILKWLTSDHYKCCPLCKQTPLIQIKKFANVYTSRKNNEINLFDANPNSITSFKIINKKPFTVENNQEIMDETIIGNRLFIACGKQIHISDIESEEKIITHRIKVNPDKEIKKQLFLQDGKLCTCYTDNTIALFDFKTGKTVEFLQNISSLNIMCIIYKDNTVIFYSIHNGDALKLNDPETENLSIKSLHVSPQGYICITYKNNKTAIFCFHRQIALRKATKKAFIDTKDKPIREIRNNNTYIYVRYTDNEFDLYESRTSKKINVAPMLTQEQTIRSISPLQRMLLIEYINGDKALFNIAEGGKCLNQKSLYLQNKKLSRFSRNGKTIFFTYIDGNKDLFDITKGGNPINQKPIHTQDRTLKYEGLLGETLYIGIYKDKEQEIDLFSTQTGLKIAIKQYIFLPKNKIALVYEDSSIELFNLNGGTKINQMLPKKTKEIKKIMVINNDAHFLKKSDKQFFIDECIITYQNDSIELLKIIDEGKEIEKHPIEAQKKPIYSFMVIDSHTTLITYKDSEEIGAFNPKTGEKIQTKSLSDEIVAIISQDSPSNNTTVRLFNTKKTALIKEFQPLVTKKNIADIIMTEAIKNSKKFTISGTKVGITSKVLAIIYEDKIDKGKEVCFYNIPDRKSTHKLILYNNLFYIPNSELVPNQTIRSKPIHYEHQTISDLYFADKDLILLVGPKNLVYLYNLATGTQINKKPITIDAPNIDSFGLMHPDIIYIANKNKDPQKSILETNLFHCDTGNKINEQSIKLSHTYTNKRVNIIQGNFLCVEYEYDAPSSDKTSWVELFDILTGKKIAHTSHNPKAIGFHNNNTIVSIQYADKKTDIFDTKTTNKINKLPLIIQKNNFAFIFIAENLLAILHADNEIEVFDIDNKEQTSRINSHTIHIPNNLNHTIQNIYIHDKKFLCIELPNFQFKIFDIYTGTALNKTLIQLQAHQMPHVYLAIEQALQKHFKTNTCANTSNTTTKKSTLKPGKQFTINENFMHHNDDVLEITLDEESNNESDNGSDNGSSDNEDEDTHEQEQIKTILDAIMTGQGSGDQEALQEIIGNTDLNNIDLQYLLNNFEKENVILVLLDLDEKDLPERIKNDEQYLTLLEEFNNDDDDDNNNDNNYDYDK